MDHDKSHRRFVGPVHPLQQDDPHYTPPTSAEQLEEIRRIVKYTLWRIATDTDAPEQAQMHAQQTFSDGGAVAEIVGRYAANHTGGGMDIDFAAFSGLDHAQTDRDPVVPYRMGADGKRYEIDEPCQHAAYTTKEHPDGGEQPWCPVCREFVEL